MALTTAFRTSGQSQTDALSYTTASVTIGVQKLVLLFVGAVTPSGGGNNMPSVSGLTLTWTPIEFALCGGQITPPQDPNRRIDAFWAVTSDSQTGSITLDWSASGNNRIGASWAVIEVTGADLISPIIQSVFSSHGIDNTLATSTSLTLSALQSINNGVFGYIYHFANETTTPGGSFTELSDNSGGASPSQSYESEWATNQTSVNWSWSTSTISAALAFEVAAFVGPSRRHPIINFQNPGIL